MSKERELLERVILEQCLCGIWSEELTKEIKDYLAQPKQPMTGEEISQSLRTDHDATNIQSYVAGVELAEKYHGIGVDGEH